MTVANHLDFVTPAAALAVYRDACRTTDPMDFEAAAHAFAAAFGRPPRRPGSPPPGPRLIVSNPPGQSARAGHNPNA